eukprot:357048-Chlamydomonas_euryale.AAC.2
MDGLLVALTVCIGNLGHNLQLHPSPTPSSFCVAARAGRSVAPAVICPLDGLCHTRFVDSCQQQQQLPVSRSRMQARPSSRPRSAD